MVKVLGWRTLETGEEEIQVDLHRWLNADDCVVMQGTGMLDAQSDFDEESHSEEIFEGDILDTSYEDGDGEGPSEWINSRDTVRYSNEHAWWHLLCSRNDMPISEMADLIVLGNIYVNPEKIAKVKDPLEKAALEQQLKETWPEGALDYLLAFGMGV
jgi:hypothetical protein